MSIEFGVMTYLGSIGALTKVVPASRIHCGEIPEKDALPAISVLRGSTDDTISMAGESGIANASIVLDCVADTYVNSKLIVELIRDGNSSQNGMATNGYSGPMGNYTVEGCFIEDEMDLDPILFPELAELKRYVARVTLSVWFEQSKATT